MHINIYISMITSIGYIAIHFYRKPYHILCIYIDIYMSSLYMSIS